MRLIYKQHIHCLLQKRTIRPSHQVEARPISNPHVNVQPGSSGTQITETGQPKNSQGHIVLGQPNHRVQTVQANDPSQPGEQEQPSTSGNDRLDQDVSTNSVCQIC